jgi:hypothetical protein
MGTFHGRCTTGSSLYRRKCEISFPVRSGRKATVDSCRQVSHKSRRRVSGRNIVVDNIDIRYPQRVYPNNLQHRNMGIKSGSLKTLMQMSQGTILRRAASIEQLLESSSSSKTIYSTDRHILATYAMSLTKALPSQRDITNSLIQLFTETLSMPGVGSIRGPVSRE